MITFIGSMITFVLSAILVGAVTGFLGRLLIPGRQDIGWRATILAGIAAALAGTVVAHLLSFADDAWIVLLVQFGLAIVCVGVVSRYQNGNQSRTEFNDGQTDVLPLPGTDPRNR
ncbi:GlsB/YeaQ/YmgE family stress response membrane protein [Streptosporangium subroseum]|uniref:GlsB/YeaQ/YmgE family stress response membrane protein n=1 Tax=Streptosporangium subroseum TaxID=106412 RepID=UPI0034198BD5